MGAPQHYPKKRKEGPIAGAWLLSIITAGYVVGKMFSVPQYSGEVRSTNFAWEAAIGASLIVATVCAIYYALRD